MSAGGRPAGPPLANGRRRTLVRLADRVARLETDLEAARDLLVLEVKAASKDGAAIRTISEAIGLSPTHVGRLVRRPTTTKDLT